MIHKYFLPILMLTGIPKSCSGLSLTEAGLASTQGLSHLCNHLHMKSAQANTPLGVFTHKTYKNLSVLFGALHNQLANKKFSSKNIEYLCTEVDLLSPKNWILFFACGYVVYKAVACGVSYLRAFRAAHRKNHPTIIILDGQQYTLTPTS